MSKNENDYIHVSDWMWAKDGLGLKIGSVDLFFFARIHQFSRLGSGEFYELQQNTAALFEVSRETIGRSTKALVQKGIIAELGVRKLSNGKTSKIYTANTSVVARAMAAFAMVDSPVSDSCDKTSHEQTSCDERSHEQTLRDETSHGGKPPASPLKTPTVNRHDASQTGGFPPAGASCDETSHEQMLRDETSHGATTHTPSPRNALVSRQYDCGNQDMQARLSTAASDAHVTKRHTELIEEEDFNDSLNPSSSSTCTNSSVGTGEGDFEAAFSALCARSLKPVSVVAEDAARAAYASARARGYTAEEIDAAYTRYVSRYRERNPDSPRFAKQLAAWLADNDGLRWDKPRPRGQGKAAPRKPAASAPSALDDNELSERLAARDATYAALRIARNEAVLASCRAIGTHASQEERERLERANKSAIAEVITYFEAHKHEVM